MCFQSLQDLGSLKMVTGRGKTVNNIIRCFRILTLMYQNIAIKADNSFTTNTVNLSLLV